MKGKRSNVKRRRKKKRKRKKLLEVFLPKFILLLFDEKVVLSKAPTGLNSVVFDPINLIRIILKFHVFHLIRYDFSYGGPVVRLKRV